MRGYEVLPVFFVGRRGAGRDGLPLVGFPLRIREVRARALDAEKALRSLRAWSSDVSMSLPPSPPVSAGLTMVRRTVLAFKR